MTPDMLHESAELLIRLLECYHNPPIDRDLREPEKIVRGLLAEIDALRREYQACIESHRRADLKREELEAENMRLRSALEIISLTKEPK